MFLWGGKGRKDKMKEANTKLSALEASRLALAVSPVDISCEVDTYGHSQEGVGLGCKLSTAHGSVFIVEIIPGGAAANSKKVFAGDLLVGVNELRVDKLVKKHTRKGITDNKAMIKDITGEMVGPPGTDCTLYIKRPDYSRSKIEVTMTRMALPSADASSASLKTSRSTSIHQEISKGQARAPETESLPNRSVLSDGSTMDGETMPKPANLSPSISSADDPLKKAQGLLAQGHFPDSADAQAEQKTFSFGEPSFPVKKSRAMPQGSSLGESSTFGQGRAPLSLDSSPQHGLHASDLEPSTLTSTDGKAAGGVSWRDVWASSQGEGRVRFQDQPQTPSNAASAASGAKGIATQVLTSSSTPSSLASNPYVSKSVEKGHEDNLMVPPGVADPARYGYNPTELQTQPLQNASASISHLLDRLNLGMLVTNSPSVKPTPLEDRLSTGKDAAGLVATETPSNLASDPLARARQLLGMTSESLDSALATAKHEQYEDQSIHSPTSGASDSAIKANRAFDHLYTPTTDLLKSSQMSNSGFPFDASEIEASTRKAKRMEWLENEVKRIAHAQGEILEYIRESGTQKYETASPTKLMTAPTAKQLGNTSVGTFKDIAGAHLEKGQLGVREPQKEQSVVAKVSGRHSNQPTSVQSPVIDGGMDPTEIERICSAGGPITADALKYTPPFRCHILSRGDWKVRIFWLCEDTLFIFKNQDDIDAVISTSGTLLKKRLKAAFLMKGAKIEPMQSAGAYKLSFFANGSYKTIQLTFNVSKARIKILQHLLIPAADREGSFVKSNEISRKRTSAFDAFMVSSSGGLLGRSSDCMVCIREESISRVHAEIYFQRSTSHFTIEDKHSKSGTYVDGKRCWPGDRVTLMNRSTLQCGNVCMEARYITPGADPALRIIVLE